MEAAKSVEVSPYGAVNDIMLLSPTWAMAKLMRVTKLSVIHPTGGLISSQLTWIEPNKWLVPFFLSYHTDQDGYDGWWVELQPQLELIVITG